MNAPTALRLHRALMRVAFSGANAFAWVFVLQFFSFFHPLHDALARTALLYALVFAISALVTPYAASRLRHGMKRGILYGVTAAFLAFAAMASAFAGIFGDAYIVGVIAFALFLGVYRALYWVPYSVESREVRARITSRTIEISVALMPACAGIILAWQVLGPAELLLAAGLCIVLSLVPLSRIPDVYERFSWGYNATFVHLFERRHRIAFFRAYMEGIQSAALFFLWPIAIFIILGSSYAKLGIVLSITLLVAFFLRAPLRTLIRNLGIKDTSVFYAVVAMSAWVGRILVATPAMIVFVDVYSRAGTGREGVDHTTFEQMADGGAFVDEYTALKEIALGFGRITLCLIAAFFALAASIPVSLLVSFLIVAAVAGASVWLAHRAATEERM